MKPLQTSTPLPIIANVARVVTKAVDRVTGDRVEFPLMVASVCVEALKPFGIDARVMYGQAAWIEILDDHSVTWAGCWGEHFHFWAATQYGEVIDLNASVAHRRAAHTTPHLKPLYSPPMLWSAEIPVFYRYRPDGIAELELTEERDQRWYQIVLSEIMEKCGPLQSGLPGIKEDALDFPNEPILCPNRKLLDDSIGTFKLFDRALATQGIPRAPF